MKYFHYLIIAVVAAAFGFGLYFVGSPKRARQQRFDERRINDLQSLQYQVFSAWERKGALPVSIADISLVDVPRDPETKQPYEYEVLGPDSYQVCASFALSTLDETGALPPYARPYPYGSKDPYYVEPYSWDHSAGRQCFTRTIDVEQYRKDHQAAR